MIIDIIGWVATIFRASGMLVRSADKVKYLISIGNLLWMINGIMSGNIPLIVSNAICLILVLYEIMNKVVRKGKNKK